MTTSQASNFVHQILQSGLHHWTRKDVVVLFSYITPP